MGSIRFAQGCSRRVIVIGRFAIKFAKGVRGRRCNLYESGVWTRNRMHPTRRLHLCPVLWCSTRGRVLIMPAAAPAPSNFDITTLDDEVGDWWDYMPGGDEWPCEPKSADWGVLNGQLVAVDYSAPAVTVGSWHASTLQRFTRH